MELIDLIPEFNLYEEFWKIYTNSDTLPPQYIAETAVVEKCIVGDGAEIHGEIYNSVIGSGVYIGKGSVIRDSIIMKSATLGDNCIMNKGIIAENVVIGDNVTLGVGPDTPNKYRPDIYTQEIVTVGEKSVIPSNVQIGKNVAITGVTTAEDYPNGNLDSGEYLVKAGGR